MIRQDFRMLLLAIGLGISVLLLTCPAKAVEVGMVQTTGSPTCEMADKDLVAVKTRFLELNTEFTAAVDSSRKLVLKEEAKAVVALGRVITIWKTENCRGA